MKRIVRFGLIALGCGILSLFTLSDALSSPQPPPPPQVIQPPSPITPSPQVIQPPSPITPPPPTQTPAETSLKQISVDTSPLAPSPGVTPLKGVLVIMSTALEQDLTRVERLLHQLNQGFFASHPYPLAIIHEDFTSELMDRLQRAAMNTVIHFVHVQFQLPLSLQSRRGEPLVQVDHPIPQRINADGKMHHHIHEHGLRPWGKRGEEYPFGYQHMCRFFSGAGFMLPFFDAYDWYWRLDTDSTCSGSIPDVFSDMNARDADYGYRTETRDGGDVVEGLWNYALQYVKEQGITPEFLDREPQATWGENGEFTQVNIFYTNFEIARLSMLRGEEYQRWFRSVDSTNNIYLHRWGDAPLRWLGLAMYTPRSRIVSVDVPCSH